MCGAAPSPVSEERLIKTNSLLGMVWTETKPKKNSEKVESAFRIFPIHRS